MRISFMTFACPQWPLKKVIAAAVEHGYHGIEFRCDANHQHGVETYTSAGERRQIRQRLEGAAIEPCCLATSLKFAEANVVEQAKLRIELASDIGCPALRVFCGPRIEGADMDRTIDTVAENLRAAADFAGHHGVDLWLETHDTMCRGADAAAAVRKADHPHVAVNYDNMHPYRMGESVKETASVLMGLVRHTHFHDALNSRDTVLIKPIGEGELPVDDMFKTLIAMDYRGYLSGEWFNDQYGPDPDTSLARFRRDVVALADRHGVTIGA